MVDCDVPQIMCPGIVYYYQYLMNEGEKLQALNKMCELSHYCSAAALAVREMVGNGTEVVDPKVNRKYIELFSQKSKARKCLMCGKKESDTAMLKVCARCKSATYCSRRCQVFRL